MTKILDEPGSVVSKAVREKLKALEEMTKSQVETDALLLASRLADKYADVHPEISALPLDAIAGFPEAKVERALK